MNKFNKNIPDHWKWVTLDDIGIIVSGGTPSTKEPEFWNGEIAWVTPADLSNFDDVYISKGQRNISQIGLEYSSATLLPENSIIFSSRAPIGYVAITKNKLSTNQGFKNLIIPSDLINPKYVYYYLKTVKELAENMASGTTFLELSASKFKEIRFPLAPIEEQNRIVEKIEELVSELEYAKNNFNESLLKLEYKFLKTLNNTFKTHYGKKYKLSEIADWGSGGTPDRKNESFFNGNIPWVKTQELKNKYITKTEEHLTIEGIKNSSAKIYPKGSIVIAMYGATVGKLSILNIDACTNQACAVGIPNSNLVNTEYLYYFLLSYKNEIISKAKGGAQQNISLSILKDFIINLLPVKEQNEIVKNIEILNSEILRQKSNLIIEIKRTDALYEKILQQAFQGKLLNQSNIYTPIESLLKEIKNSKETYIKEQQDLIKKHQKIERKKINLLDNIKNIFKSEEFDFQELSSKIIISRAELEKEFDKLIDNNHLVKLYDKESKSIKYKLI